MGEHVAAGVLAEVAAGGAADAGGLPTELLGDFLTVVTEAVAAGRRIPSRELRRFQVLGDAAARQGVALRALLDLYLSSAWRLWPRLPAVVEGTDAAGVIVAGQVMLHAVDDIVAELAEGYQLARRSLLRAQESARREFIDDLLNGVSDVVGLLHRADGFGLDLSGPHAVATVESQRPLNDASPLIRTIERAILGIKGDAQALLATKEGRLVVVFPAPDAAAIDFVTGRMRAVLDSDAGAAALAGWRVGLGRAASGADGVVSSYRESLDVLRVAAGLGIDLPVIDARDLLAYRVLLRDRAALADLVESTLGRLRRARGGAVPLIDTLLAFFRTGQNTAETARRLNLSVRAVTYRLGRVRELTGLDDRRPDDRFTLHVAALGARMLNWPTAGAE